MPESTESNELPGIAVIDLFYELKGQCTMYGAPDPVKTEAVLDHLIAGLEKFRRNTKMKLEQALDMEKQRTVAPYYTSRRNSFLYKAFCQLDPTIPVWVRLEALASHAQRVNTLNRAPQDPVRLILWNARQLDGRPLPKTSEGLWAAINPQVEEGLDESRTEFNDEDTDYGLGHSGLG